MADRSLEQRRDLHRDTVASIDPRGADAVADDLMGGSLRLSAGELATLPSVDDVYTALITELSRTHVAAVTATISRRRSLTESLDAALLAYWETVVAHREAVCAVRSIQARRMDIAAPGDQVQAARLSAMSGVSTWLGLIADAHRLRWELPDDQLTLLVTATLEGLVMNYLATGDPYPARPVLRVLAYQVARYGRRPAKNQQH